MELSRHEMKELSLAIPSAKPCGLLVWIPAGDDAEAPRGWLRVLADRGIAWCGLKNAGNTVDGRERVWLARRAPILVSRLGWPIDPARTFVGGFSGGARAASVAAMGSPDSFPGGALLCGGVGYWRDVWVDADGRSLPRILAQTLTAEGAAAASRQRYAIVIGESDNWLNPARAVSEAMKSDSHAGVSLFAVPGLGHDLPALDVFGYALHAIDPAPAAAKAALR